MTYQLVYDQRSQSINSAVILRTTDGSWISCYPNNTDYQEYLAWLAEGNEPLPADSE
jgi:hypothetical protein